MHLSLYRHSEIMIAFRILVWETQYTEWMHYLFHVAVVVYLLGFLQLLIIFTPSLHPTTVTTNVHYGSRSYSIQVLLFLIVSRSCLNWSLTGCIVSMNIILPRSVRVLQLSASLSQFIGNLIFIMGLGIDDRYL